MLPRDRRYRAGGRFFRGGVLGRHHQAAVAEDNENEGCSTTQSECEQLAVFVYELLRLAVQLVHIHNCFFLVRFLRHENWVTEAKNKKFALCGSNIFIWFISKTLPARM